MKPRRAWIMAAIMTVMIAVPCGTHADTVQKLKDLYRRPATIPHPGYNPPSPAKARLGKALFFDPRLSGSDAFACATCHNPEMGWEDGLPRSFGETGKQLARHTPTLLNLAWSLRFGWDGRIPTLEGFVLGPISNPHEMNQNLDTLISELTALSGYRELFAKAFPGQKPAVDHVSLAIAAFERTIVAPPSAFDAWIDGDENAISAAAKAGFRLFNEKAGCGQCHKGWNFTDNAFHDIGIADPDFGRGGLADAAAETRHAFKTPTLRQIDHRAPFMHDGSLDSLDAVITHYAEKFQRRPTLAKEINPLSLDAHEKFNLLAFLGTLTAQAKPVSAPPLPDR